MPLRIVDMKHLIAALILINLVALAEPHGPSLNPRVLFSAANVRILRDQKATLLLSTDKFTRNNQGVQVTVQQAERPEKDDLLALYVPATADPRRTVPVNWHNITEVSPSYLKTGSASLNFNLLNFRGSFIFRLLKNGTFNPIIVAESRPILNTIARQPSQVHVALHANSSSFVIQWHSSSSTPQQLLYWTSSPQGQSAQPPKTAARATSQTLTYTADMMCGAPATTIGFISPGFIHRALLPYTTARLGSNTRVHYRVGSDAAGWSQTFTVTTPPKPGSSEGVSKTPQQGFKFLVFNDVGQADPILFNNTRCPPYCPLGFHWDVEYTLNSTKLARYLAREEDAQLGLLIGDLSYANGYAADWDVFGHQFESVFSSWPLMTAPGNHERDWPGTGDALQDKSDASGGECNVPYTYRFYTPNQSPAGVEGRAAIGGSSSSPAAGSSSSSSWVKHWGSSQQGLLGLDMDPRTSYYSFNMGNVHFLMLDSETPSGPETPQGRFAAADLAKVDRKKTPWLVVGMHRMMLAPSTFSAPVVGDIENMQRLQGDYEELFKKFKVNLVVSGHEHAYARTCPWYKGSCMPTKRQKVTISSSSSTVTERAGGRGKYEVTALYRPAAPVYVLAGHAGAGFTTSLPEVIPNWVEYATQVKNGYLRMVATSSTMLVESVSTDDGSIIDGVQISM